MIVVMASRAQEQDLKRVIDIITEKGYKHSLYHDKNQYIIGVIGDVKGQDKQQLEACDEVEKVVTVTHPFKLASREFFQDTTVINVKGIAIGGSKMVVMAGPCAVEGRDITLDIAKRMKELGVSVLRGGAFKPRTSPYSFQGLGREGLDYLKEAGDLTGLPVISEVLSPEDVEMAYEFIDIFQIGSRNAQNFSLLREVGGTDKPVMLKRGMMNTIEEWLMSAEYILSEGNSKVILCERGIRTFEKYTRNTLDLSAVPVIKRLSHLPIMVDPSHGTGHWRLVAPMAKAAVAAGCDGLIVEVHPDPENALSDGQQSLNYEKFESLMEELKPVARAVGRSI
ncbi:MAG: 2-keto-3-deoxy-D-arabino-heptulosonate-7-phosphate synthase I beta [Firmicutes bacterium]|nr:2-keto-3-deoxy-D-arabino-heptulosonate-7-phosphate synthase I beta [Bacillota bacterium]MDI6705410.1 3-deoxy-7-phosphoheptulonate synthase [Bacillota bacterium]